jgi:predicted transcriptional regulator
VSTQTLSIRLDPEVRQRLEALARQSKRSKSFLAAEAIAAFVAQEEWQLAEVEAGIAEVEAGQSVPHDEVVGWLKSWGSKKEKRSPR